MNTKTAFKVRGQVVGVCKPNGSMATDDELQSGLDWWRDMIDSGSAGAFMEQREERRAIVGMTTSVTAVKAATYS